MLLWSRTALHAVDPIGDEGLPHQGFVSARSVTPIGELDLICACIPWHDAGVRRFGGECERWGAHLKYLEVLEPLLRKRSSERPLVMAGDFNQYIPHVWTPHRAYDALHECIRDLDIATAGRISGYPDQLIDHVVHSRTLSAVDARAWPGRTPDDRPMSDHAGVRVDLVLRD